MRRCLPSLVAAALLGATAGGVAPEPAEAVVGGDEADPGEWPWQLAYQVEGETVCGAALLALDVAVTAAHCTDGIDERDISVLAGSVADGDGQRRRVQRVEQHEGYDRTTTRNDIAVLILDVPYEASSSIAPVGVPAPSTSAALAAAGATAVVTGFGATSEEGLVSPVLREAEVPIVDDVTCAARYAEDGDQVFGDTQVCAGHDRGHVDACFGDSGGPLVVPGDDDRTSWLLVGLVSWGAGCGRALRPTVYTEVAAYAGWLADHGAGGAAGTRFEPDPGARPLQLPAAGATRGKASRYPATIGVRGFDEPVSSVAVELHGLSHERPSDLDIWLEAPDGTVVTLLSDAGGDEPVVDLDVVVEAGGPAGGAGRLGLRVAPTDLEGDAQRKGAAPPASLDALAGVDAHGRWRLLVADDTEGASGSLEGWTLVLR